ncbi:MAG: hypothetical protein NZ898_01305 [Myxococcota bacterium]|nr:hypothetical protein [Myxococcota bacterium]MDW8360768.1 hypothetical protein [Myxococcales bacterium]
MNKAGVPVELAPDHASRMASTLLRGLRARLVFGGENARRARLGAVRGG